MAGGEHPGILYFYSESVGLGANGACALLAAFANLGIAERGDPSTGWLFLVVGGAVQLLCSLRAFRAYDHFGATVLGFYAAFWAVLGLEILLSANIHLLHGALVVASGLLSFVAPLVNGFYTALVGSITVVAGLELALRVVPDGGPAALEMATGISEIVVVLATSYGVAAAVLHGVHQRQVLPGFDDAVVETVLWKRKALKSKYSDGKWANPLPIGGICRAMGFAGLAAASSWDSAGGLAVWFSTFAAILAVSSLVHGLRHERIWAVSSVCDASLLAVAANGGDFVAFAVVRLFLLCFAVAEVFSLVYVSAFALEVISLSVAVGIGSSGAGAVASSASTVLFCVTSALAIYGGIAEAANSIAQKELLPMLQEWSLPNHPCANKAERDLFDPASTHKPSRPYVNVEKNAHKGDVGGPSEESDSVEKSVNKGDEEQGHRPATIERNQTRRLSFPSVSSFVSDIFNRSPGSDTNDLPDSDDVDHKYPGDRSILGYSDFQSPLFVLCAGLALYSIVASVGMFGARVSVTMDGALVLLVTQTSSLLISAARGQTCFGFLSFTYVLEGIVLLVGSSAASRNLIVVLVLQAAWLAASFRVFRPLSASTGVHLTGLLCYVISGTVSSGGPWRDLAGASFALTAIVSLVTLGVLLGSAKSTLCRRLLRHSAADSEKLCEVGFASDREQFDEEAFAAYQPTHAIKRIYDIKSRPSEKPLSLWLGSIDDIKGVAPEGEGWSQKLFAFMEEIWPGSVSLVVSRGSWLQRMGVGDAADLIGTPDSIALRVPNSTLTVSLLRETGPLAITSANPSGACDCTHHNKVDDLIASKIDYILADGASPMTIASSVVDVRRVDNNELFFYRVGCVPEEVIWNTLNATIEDVPPMLADLEVTNELKIESFMSQLTSIVNCQRYRIFMLVSSEDGHDSCDFVTRKPWQDMAARHRRVRAAFLSGITYYNSGGSEVQEDGLSQLIFPVRDTHGMIVAVVQLMDKVSDGRTIPFQKSDLQCANLASSVLRDAIVAQPATDAQSSQWQDEIQVVILSENGYGQRNIDRDMKGERDTSRPKRRRSTQ